MKVIQRVIGISSCALGALAIAPTASAEIQRGFYLGVSAGESTFDLEKDEFDAITISSWAAAGAPVLSRSSKFEDSDTTWSLFAGYQILKFVAVEAAYFDLGAAEYRWSGTVNPPGIVSVAPATMNVTVEAKGLKVNGIGSLPLGNYVDLHGRLGFLYAETKLSVTAALGSPTIGSGTGSDSDTLKSFTPLFGVGAGFHFGEHFSLSLDWTRHANVGDEDGDEDDDWETQGGIDIDALTLSALVRF